MKSVTQKALSAILSEEYCTPEESLKYLQSETHFMTFAVELARRLGVSGKKNSSEETCNEIVQILHKKQLAPSRDRYIRKWFSGDSGPDRGYAIKLCFALGLTESESIEFLRKACGYNGFNFRDAKEIVYYYCLKYGKTYDRALEIIERYDSTPCDEKEAVTADKGTRTIQNIFVPILAEDEAAFIDLLCANKANFFGYSRTAYKKYLELKRRLTVRIVQSSLNSAYLFKFQDDVYIALVNLLVGLAKGDADFDSDLKGFKVTKPAPDTELLWSRLMKKIESRPFLNWVHEKSVNGQAKPVEETLTRDQFFQKLVSNDMLLQLIYLGIPFVKKTVVNMDTQKTTIDNNLLPLPNKTLKKALEGTTYAQYFSEMDNDPRKVKRAALVLLFFADYFFDYHPGTDPTEGVYADFYVNLDNMLADCGMAHLYPASQLDWFILKSAKALESKDRNDDNNDPILFFNKVLELSFPPDVEEWADRED
ncbi:MAG: hypothetical protein ABF497_08090 [Sporolactobacillus sp.]